MKKTKLYKVLLPGGEPAHGGSGRWVLPKDSKPGAWMLAIKNPKCCERGYHLVTAVQLIKWLDRDGLEVWEAEGRGDHHDQDDKSAWAEARLTKRIGKWTDETARLFAADCAEAVLHIFEKAYPNDDRPRKAIEAARAFALGKIDAATMDAAGEAAKAAAGTAWAAWAAWAATRDAAWAATRAATWSAAGSAARSAAGTAAWTAAGIARAVWSAAGAAARSAAGTAAWSAAEAAAWAAAEAAAGTAARDAQSRRLLYWLQVGS